MTLRSFVQNLFAVEKPKIPKEPPKGQVGFVDESMIYGTDDFTRYNPDELIERKGYKIYKKMMRDDQVKAVAQFKRSAVVSRGYYFDVKTSDNDDKKKDKLQEEQADFFQTVIDKIEGSFKDALDSILTGMQNGYSITEKVYTPIKHNKKTRWGVKKLTLLPFETFDGGFTTDDYGNITKITQTIGAKENNIPVGKVIHFVYSPDMDPIYGESDLRAAHRAWWSKDIAIKFQNIHLERHAGGIWKATVNDPAAIANPAEKTKLKNTLKNITAMTGILLPKGIDAEIVPPVRTDAYDRAIMQYDKAIAKAMLVPNLLGLSEQGKVGSYAQSETQFEVFLWILSRVAERLSELLNENLFRELSVWNFGTDEYPRFKFEPMSDHEKRELAKTWAELVSKGAAQRTDDDENHTRMLLGYPEKPEEEEPEIPPGTPPGQVPPGATPPGQAPPEPGIQNPGQGDIDEMLDPEVIKANASWISKFEEFRQDEIEKEFAETPWLKRVNFGKLERTLDGLDKPFSEELADQMAEVKVSLESQIANVVGDRSLGNVRPQEFSDLRFPKKNATAIRKLSRKNLMKSFDQNYAIAEAELPKKRLAKVIRPGMDKTQAERFLASRSMTIAGTLDKDTLENVSLVLQNAIKYDKNLTQTINSMRDNTDLVAMLPETDAAGRKINVPARLENIARTNNADAMNQARMSLFGDPSLKGFVQAFQYSAILDERTTEICRHLDGKIRRDFGEYVPPNHYQCRSLLVPVLAIDDWNGRESRPPSLEPQKGFA